MLENNENLQLLNQLKFHLVQRMKMKLFYQQLIFLLVEEVVVGVVSQGFELSFLFLICSYEGFRVGVI